MTPAFDDTTPMPSAAAAIDIDAICDCFEERLQAGETPDIEGYVEEVDPLLQRTLLRELLLLRWEYDSKHGQTIAVDSFLKRFPEHAGVILAAATEQLSDLRPNEQGSAFRLPERPFTTPLAMRRWRDLGYQIERQLGSGGMGTVLLARESATKRHVALKVLRSDLSINQRGMERFRAEVQALRSFQHPHIVQIYEINVECDEPFYTMEYCSGGSLANFLRKRRLSFRESAQLIEMLARAVHTAHQNGIAHRDLKPGNVLLQGTLNTPEGTREGQPEANPDASVADDELWSILTPKLADFGLAKDLSSDTLTHTGELLGSLPYMAPEQVGSKQSMGLSVDIHALGVILFRCLTGELPFVGETPGKTIQKVLSEVPKSPQRLDPSVPVDLSAICDRCLEKLPADRYASALDLAEDLRRFLNHQPTQARPLGTAQQCVRWAQRHPKQLAIMAAICCFFAAIAIGLADYNNRLEKANEQLKSSKARAEASEQRARLLQYGSDIRLAAKYYQEGDLKTVRDILEAYLPADDAQDLRGIEWHFLNRATRFTGFTLDDVNSPIYCVRRSPDGTLLATAGEDSVIRIYDAQSGTRLESISSRQTEVNSVAFSDDSTLLASAGDDGTICVWRLADNEELLRFKAHDGIAFGVQFLSNEGQLVSCGEDGFVRRWKNDELIDEYDDHGDRVEAIDVSADRRFFASVGKAGRLMLRTADGNKLAWTDLLSFITLSSVAFSPDSKQIAITQNGETKAIRVFEIENGNLLWMRIQPDTIHSLAFSPDGTRLLTSDKSGVCRIWNLDSTSTAANQLRKPTRLWQAHDSRVYGAIFEEDQYSVLTVGQDGLLKRWETKQSLASSVLAQNDSSVFQSRTEVPTLFESAAFLPKSGELVVPSGSGLTFLEIGKEHEPRYVSSQNQLNWQWIAAPAEGNVFFVAGSPTPDFIADTEPLLATVQCRSNSSDPNRNVFQSLADCNINDLACSPNGELLAVLLQERRTRGRKRLMLIDAHSGKILEQFPAAFGTKSQFSQDGKHLFFGVQRDLHVYNLVTGQRQAIQGAHRDSQREMALSHDDQWLATSDDRCIYLWNVNKLDKPVLLQGHQGLITALDFSADDRTLLSSSQDGTVKAWSVLTGQPLMDLHRGKESINHIALCPERSQLIVIEDQHRILLYNLRPEFDIED